MKRGGWSLAFLNCVVLILSLLLLDASPFTFDSPPARADTPGDWPMFGHDPAHTGITRTGSGSLHPCGGTARSRT